MNLRSLLWTNLALLALCLSFLSPGTAFAQDAGKDEEDKIPAPKDVLLETKDGVALQCTYYGGFLGKSAIPFMMVHGWGGNRGEYDLLAKEMQRRGHAAITIDLRGHGDSTHFKDKDDPRGDIKPDRFTGRDIDSMMRDLEAAKSYLVDRNNEGELNIEALSVVAAGEGAIVAIKWAVADWNAPVLPSLKQGQDVKALFLLSPVLSFKGSTVQQFLTSKTMNRSVSVFIAAGKRDSKAVADSKRLYNTLAQYRKSTSGDAAEVELILKDDPKKMERVEVFYDLDDTNLGGTKLLGVQGLKVFGWMLRFVKLELVDRMDEFDWTERRRF